MRIVHEKTGFIGNQRASMCDSCVCYCVPEGSVVFTLRLDSSQGALQGRWQMASVGRGSVPGADTPAASRQSIPKPQGGFLGHTHLTQGADRQVNLKHTAGALTNTCRHTLISTHVDM